MPDDDWDSFVTVISDVDVPPSDVDGPPSS